MIPGEIHTRSQIYNFDDDDGRSNIFVDQWTTIPKGNAVEMNYLVESQEPQAFTDCQEFPVAFVQPILNQAYRYTGGVPWTGAAAEIVSVPVGANAMPPFSNTTEPWIAWIGADGTGLALYLPTGETHDMWSFHRVYDGGTTQTHVLQNWGCFTLNPGEQRSQHAFLVYGSLDMIRSTVYEYEGHTWFHDEGGLSPWLNKLLRNSITSGCATNPPQYCPSAAIPREQMAVFLLTAKHGPAYSPAACTTAPYSDVPTSNPFCRWIRAAQEQGIMLGGTTEDCSISGGFCPTNVVTRAHMAAFLLRAKDGGSYLPPACTSPMFQDVPASDPYCRWIEELARRGITGGCGGGNYCPTASNTRGQMAVFISTNWDLK